MYFYSLSVNYNNRSPAFCNDSQNIMHCSRRASIIYELTNNILTNNNMARLYFIMTRTMLFSCGNAQQIINNRNKNAADSLAVSRAVQIRRYDAQHIAHYGRSRATLDATGCRHRVSIHPVLPQRTPWSSISV
jgi:hypothetical protein